jgi:hypothetical protein
VIVVNKKLDLDIGYDVVYKTWILSEKSVII